MSDATKATLYAAVGLPDNASTAAKVTLYVVTTGVAVPRKRVTGRTRYGDNN